MLAARLNVVDHRLDVVEVPTPEPGPNQVRIKVEAAGVCLSDVHLVQGMLTPMFLDGDVVTLGHEVAGTIDALGPEVSGWTVGQRVTLQAGELAAAQVLTRGVDYDGGWAEYALATVATLVPIPDSLPFEQAAIIPDAVSTPWGAIVGTGGVRPGEAVGVWGIGGLGAHAVQLLRMVGAAPIIAIDPLPAARDRALEYGADLALDAADPQLPVQVRSATDGRGLAAAIDFAGLQTAWEQAMQCLGHSGRLVLVGLGPQPLTVPNPTLVSFLGQQIRGHYGSGPDDLAVLVGLYQHGRLDFAKSISEVLPLSDAVQAVDRLERKEGNPVRIVLKP